MINSIAEKRGTIAFPTFANEKIYMQPFYKKDGLAKQFKHWQATVDSMLEGIETDLPIYLMVDQAMVKAEQPHRRPGLHVDGYWVANRHGGHRGISAHGGHGSGVHLPNLPPRWQSLPDTHLGGNGGWDKIDFSAPEGIILASNIKACAAYTGIYDEQCLGHGGDASNIQGDFNRIDFEADYVYAGNVGMLHESLPVPYDCLRTVVRLNVPGWSPTIH